MADFDKQWHKIFTEVKRNKFLGRDEESIFSLCKRLEVSLIKLGCFEKKEQYLPK
jgi:hypothetical protein